MGSFDVRKDSQSELTEEQKKTLETNATLQKICDVLKQSPIFKVAESFGLIGASYSSKNEEFEALDTEIKNKVTEIFHSHPDFILYQDFQRKIKLI